MNALTPVFASPGLPDSRVLQSAAPCRDTAALIAARQPDLPVFCFSAPALGAAFKRFRAGLSGALCFAVKAAPLPAVIETLLAAEIDGFDVASPGEMALVRAQSATATLYYNNPIKSAGEIAAAYRGYGVSHFTVDDMNELDKVARIVPPSSAVEIAVRFRLPDDAYDANAAYAFHTKFGALAGDAAALLRQAATYGYAVSLSFHPGSQCVSPAAYEAHIAAAGQIANDAGVRLARLNVGGGFPAAYPGSAAPNVERYFAAIEATAARTFARPVALMAEPGRALAAPAMSLLTRIKHRRANGDIFLNDGLYGGLMELLMADIALPVRCFAPDGCLRAGRQTQTTVFGPTCDSIDRLPRRLSLPCTASEGDYVEFALAGAYSASTVTRFNGYGDLTVVAVDDIFQA